MEAEISVDFDSDGVDQESINDILGELQQEFPDVDIDIDELAEPDNENREGEGAFPPPPDPYTLYLTASASVQLIACLYPKLKERISELSGSIDIDNIEEVAREYLDSHTRVSKGDLEIVDVDRQGDRIDFQYTDVSDNSTHSIEINREDISDWTYEEI